MKRKINLKKIIGVVLVVALLVGSIAAISAFAKDETDTISSLKFSRGSIDKNTGLYVESELSLYTEQPIACNGLTITPDFESTSSYQLFWYNLDKKYVGYSRVYTPGETFAATDVPTMAWYCRVVITPSNIGEDGKVDKDFRIRFWEVNGYANDLKIEVAKNQDSAIHDIYKTAAVYTPEGEYVEENTRTILDKYNGAFILDNYVNSDPGQYDSTDTSFIVSANEEYHLLFIDVSELSTLYIENELDVWVGVYCYNDETETIEKSGYYKVEAGSKAVNEAAFNNTTFITIQFHGEIGLDVNVYEYMPRTVGQIG